MRTLSQLIYTLAKQNKAVNKLAKWVKNDFPIYLVKAKAIVGAATVFDPPNLEDVIPDVSLLPKSELTDFRQLDPQDQIDRNLPQSIYPEADEVFLQQQSVLIPRTFTAILRKGRVLQDGYVLSSGGKIVEEVSTFMIGTTNIPIDHTHPIFTTGIGNAPATKKAGRIAVLASPFAGTNYYHFMLDLLPRLEVLRRSGYQWDQIDGFYINSNLSQFQKESFENLGIPASKLVDSLWHPHIEVEKLLVPSRVGKSGDFPDWALEFVRSIFLKKSSKKGGRRIYINRRMARYRRVLNEEEIEAKLSEFGFESVSFDNLTVAQQAEMMAECEAVISPHGAGLTNLIFCSPGTIVIEMFLHDTFNLMYWGIADALGLDYFYLKSPEKETSEIPGEGNFRDLFFSVDEIEKTLIQAGLNQR